MEYNFEQVEDDEERWSGVWGGRDGLIFLVDCSKKMYEEQKFHDVMEIIETVMKNLIIKNEKNLIGVLFYNVEKSLPPFNEPDETGIVEANNISVFMSLKTLSADSIKYIRKYRETQMNNLPDQYGHCDSNAGCLNDAFWIASKMLRNCGYKLNQAKILVLTNNTTPFQHDSDEERNAFKKAEDLRDSGVIVNVVPMSDTFSGDPFYTQFLSIVHDEETQDIQADLENPSQQREALLNRVFQKDFRKRCNQRIKFQFGQGLEMSVGIYSMYRVAKPPKKVTLQRKDNEIVQAKRVNVVAQPEPDDVEMQEDPGSSSNVVPMEVQANTGPTSNIMPMEIKKYQNIGFEKIAFTTEEFTKMKRVRDPGLILLGFKPKSTVTPKAHLRGPNFMYPDETIIKGSTQLFIALWEKCLQLEKVVYAILIERVQANPKLVVLVPQEEQSGRYQRYSGFRIEYIPYSDCIREIEALYDQPIIETEQEEIDLFKKIAKSLRFRYNPTAFHNPVVQGRYDVIEAEVLQETPPKTEDTTKPNVEVQDEKLANLIESFETLYQLDTAITQKRASLSLTGSRPAKVAKTFDPKEIEAAYDNKSLVSYTVDNLKAYLTQHNKTGLSKLKKKDLIAMVEEVIEDRVLASVKL